MPTHSDPAPRLPSRRIAVPASLALIADGVYGLSRGFPPTSESDVIVFLWGPNGAIAIAVGISLAWVSLCPERAIAKASWVSRVSPAVQPPELPGPRGFPWRPMSLAYALLFIAALLFASSLLSALSYLFIPALRWGTPIFLIRGLSGCVALVAFGRLSRAALVPTQT